MINRKGEVVKTQTITNIVMFMMNHADTLSFPDAFGQIMGDYLLWRWYHFFECNFCQFWTALDFRNREILMNFANKYYEQKGEPCITKTPE